jgi:hypothetical protein
VRRSRALVALAWVTWLHSVFANRDISEWKQLGSAATLEECTQTAATVARETIEHFRAPNDGATYVLEGLLIEVRFPWGEKASHAFVCLPDTVDPRGPKGSVW